VLSGPLLTSRPGAGDILRLRYLTCQRCGLKVKSEEKLAVPWDEGDLIAQVTALLPEGQAVALREQGITELPLAWLNAILKRHGLVIHASKARDAQRVVACTTQDGRVEPYGLFELRRIQSQAPGRTNGRRRQGREPQSNDREPEASVSGVTMAL
jgi:hypothetical protein